MKDGTKDRDYRCPNCDSPDLVSIQNKAFDGELLECSSGRFFRNFSILLAHGKEPENDLLFVHLSPMAGGTQNRQRGRLVLRLDKPLVSLIQGSIYSMTSSDSIYKEEKEAADSTVRK
jgi:hypothetical protein